VVGSSFGFGLVRCLERYQLVRLPNLNTQFHFAGGCDFLTLPPFPPLPSLPSPPFPSLSPSLSSPPPPSSPSLTPSPPPFPALPSSELISGTGKSFVLSLFYDLIPTTHKRRWHYHAFTLFLYREVFVEMERRRKEEREGVKEENKDKAGKRGWKSVFAGGKWEEGDEAALEDYEKVETIAFIGGFTIWTCACS